MAKVPSAVFREVAEQWLASFDTREAGLVVLGAATDMPADSWRKRLSEATFTTRTGTIGSHGWYHKAFLDEESVDEFLTAANRTDLWHVEPLSAYLPEATEDEQDFHATCVDCGTWIDWREPGAGVTVEIGQMVNVRRRYRWFSLCPVCASYRLPLPKPMPDATGRRNRKMPNEVVHKAYLAYVRQGAGMTVVAEQLYERYGYASPQSCVSSLYQKWHAAGWPMRNRSATKKQNRTNSHTGRYRSTKITDQALRQAYVLHVRHDMSMNELGRRLYEKFGYQSGPGCARAISAGWRRLGLQARDRIEMTVLASTTNGLSPRDAKERRRRRVEAGLTTQLKQRQARCTGTVTNGKRKGERCERPAVTGAHFCPAHDPARAQQRRDHLVRMRSRSPRHRPENTVAVGSILDELAAYHRLYGRWKTLADVTGIDQSVLYRMSKRPPDERMMIDTYRRLRTGLDTLIPVRMSVAA